MNRIMFDLRIAKRFGTFSLDVRGTSSSRVLGVVGPSGSGKSTLLNVIAGFTDADDADVAIGEHQLIHATDGSKTTPVHRRGVGYVCQTPLLFPHLSVQANLAYGLGAHGDHPPLDGVVDRLELRPLLAQRAATLSGGEARRVAIGRALLSAPRVMLLDEPLAGLDARLARRTLALVHRVCDAYQIPTIYVSHTVSDVLFLCEEVWRLSKGRVVTIGRPRDVIANAPVEDPAAWADLRNHFLARRDSSESEQFTVFCAGACRLVVADTWAEPCTGSAMLSIHASDILLARDLPSRISARNVLPGRVTRIEKHGRSVLVFVDVGVEWMVRLTPSATEELALAPGVETYAIVKASAISAVSA